MRVFFIGFGQAGGKIVRYVPGKDKNRIHDGIVINTRTEWV